MIKYKKVCDITNSIYNKRVEEELKEYNSSILKQAEKGIYSVELYFYARNDYTFKPFQVSEYYKNLGFDTKFRYDSENICSIISISWEKGRYTDVLHNNKY